MNAILEYLESNHTKMTKINQCIEEAVEVIEVYRKEIYRLVVEKEIVDFDADIELLVLLDDLQYFINKLHNYDYDFYLAENIIRKTQPSDNLKIDYYIGMLVDDLTYYDQTIKDLSYASC